MCSLFDFLGQCLVIFPGTEKSFDHKCHFDPFLKLILLQLILDFASKRSHHHTSHHFILCLFFKARDNQKL